MSDDYSLDKLSSDIDILLGLKLSVRDIVSVPDYPLDFSEEDIPSIYKDNEKAVRSANSSVFPGLHAVQKPTEHLH